MNKFNQRGRRVVHLKTQNNAGRNISRTSVSAHRK
jgi:hypothetical protein